MSRHQSYAAAIAAIQATTATGASKYRVPRVIRFIHNHPEAHRAIITKLRRRQQEHELACDVRFRELRAQPADLKPRRPDPPWTRRGRRLARKRGAK